MIAPIPDWRKQVELQQRELSEMMRLEQQRLQAKLQEQVHENEKFWKNVDRLGGLCILCV